MKTIHARHLYIGTTAERGVAAPPSNAQGAGFFDTDTETMFYWDGNSWESFGAGGNDPNAIHDNAANEITAIAEKVAPVGNDELVIEDSEAAFVKKSVKITNLPGGADADAIHDNVAAEINAIAEKVAPAATDILLIEDSAAGNAKKKVQITNLPGGGDADAIHDNVAAEISAIVEKAAPIAADLIIIEDSADANAKKRVQLGNLPSTDADAIHDNVAAEISAIAEKTVPVANDIVLMEDSAAANAKKRILMKNLYDKALGSMVGVYLSTNQTGVVDNTETTVELDTEEYDYGSEFNTATHEFTANVDGLYLVIAKVRYLSAIPANYYAQIHLDTGGGYSNVGMYVMYFGAGGGAHITPTLVKVYELDAGDKLKMVAYHTSGSNRTLLSGVHSTYLQIIRMA